MLQDIPLLAQVKAILHAHKAFGKNKDFLTNYLLQAESPHELAACLIAIRIECGSFGDGDSGWQRNKLVDAGLALAEALYADVVKNLHRGFEKKVLTKTYNQPKVVTNLDNVIQLSDEARKQQKEYREANGSNYIGTRMVQPKARNVTGYYWDRKVGANVVSYNR